jgi:putative acetyltransferase
MIIRPFKIGDESCILDVYRSAIHQIAIRDYTLEQIQAWAPDNIDFDVWCNRMRGINPFVVEIDGHIVGYADVQSNGYVDHFFVSGHHPGQGIGKVLMRHLINEAKFRNLTTMTSDVSKTAQGFFEKFGFQIVEHKNVVIRGVVLGNAHMLKVL